MRYGLIPQSRSEKNALEQAPHARVLFEPFLPIVLARALMAFVRLGLAQSLAEQSKGPAEIAAELGLREAGIRHLLRVLAASGYVSIASKVGIPDREDAFELTPLSRATLLKDGPAALDAWVLHNHVHWRAISNIEHVLTSDGDRDLHHHLDSAEEWAVYQRAMLQTARPAAESVAGLIPEPAGRDFLLDLGGAHGLYGAAICRRFPPMRSRVIDFPDAIAHARAFGEEAGITDVVEYAQGDIRTIDLHEEICDVVFMGNIVHHFSDEALQAILRNVHRALKPGGVIAIWDMAPPEDLPELDLVAEGFSMLFYLTSASECRGPDVYRNVLTACGFGQVDVQSGSSPTHILITGRR